MADHVERSRVVTTGTNIAVKARDGFDVVIVNIDWRADDDIDALERSLKIRHQHFDARRRWQGLDRAGSRREVRGATIGKVVAIDRGHNNVLEAEFRDRFGNPQWLIGIERTRPAMRDGAIRAIARAYIAHQHESRRAMRKAFADIRAARFLAIGVYLQLTENRLGAEIFRRHRGADFDPIGMSSLGHCYRSACVSAGCESIEFQISSALATVVEA